MAPPESLPPQGAGGQLDVTRVEHADRSLRHCRDWLRWAAAQVDACMATDSAAMDQLLASLDGLIGTSGAHSSGGCANPGSHDRTAAAVISVQAHDRVMQGLAHVADSMRELAAQLAPGANAGSEEAWRELRERRFRTFSMAEERALFARMVAQESDPFRFSAGPSAAAIEMFSGDDQLFYGHDEEL